MFVFHQKENICIIEEWKSVARNEDYLTSRLQGNSSLHLSAEKEPDLDFDMNIEKRLFFCGFIFAIFIKDEKKFKDIIIKIENKVIFFQSINLSKF